MERWVLRFARWRLCVMLFFIRAIRVIRGFLTVAIQGGFVFRDYLGKIIFTVRHPSLSYPLKSDP